MKKRNLGLILLLTCLTGGIYLLFLIPRRKLLKSKGIRRLIGIVGGGFIVLFLVFWIMSIVAPEPMITVISSTSIQNQTTGYTLELELENVEELIVQKQNIPIKSGQILANVDIILTYPKTQIEITASNRGAVKDKIVVITRPKMEYDKTIEIMDNAKEMFPDIMMATYVADEMTQRKFGETLGGKRDTYYIEARHNTLINLLDNTTYDFNVLKELTLKIYTKGMDEGRQQPIRDDKEIYKFFMDEKEYESRLENKNKEDELNMARNNVINNEDSMYLYLFKACQSRVNCDDCEIPYISASRNNIFKGDTDEDLIIQGKIKGENVYGGKVTQKLNCYYRYNDVTKRFNFIDLEIQ